MTTTTTNILTQGVFARMFKAFITGFEAHARLMSRRDLIETLEAKSDEELAVLGVKREEISRFVFRDLFYA